jgi:hypothetical protein
MIGIENRLMPYVEFDHNFNEFKSYTDEIFF